MENRKTKNNCTTIRAWLFKLINSRIGLNADWVRNHIADCPRCRKRLALVGKVELALSVIKSQPHSLDLLMRANAQAIGVLKHSLRNAPKAQKLKAILPEPKLLETCGKYKHSLANAVACLALLFLMKIGIFSSMEKFQNQGSRTVKNYYATHVGQEMADDIFSA
ncbi:MAG: hypothetical protein ACYS9Y_14595 [Planctomycetota bacterium]|jgi:hypothetical protein